MPTVLEKLGLRFNPFEPSASGAPLEENLWLPSNSNSRLQEILNIGTSGQGVKAIPIIGAYGTGKTYLLQWLYRKELPHRRIRPFYFDNPGVRFYDLANSLLRQIGRKDFAKCLWELAAPHVTIQQRDFFARGFEEYLCSQNTQRHKLNILPDLQEAIIKVDITSDEEIAHRLARIIAETPTKPYFEYRDFVAGKRDSLVAEGEEAPYFRAILRALRLSGGISAIAFLIDEFEEISLQKRLARREAHDYLVTLKRLINLAQSEDLWLIVAMTPDAADETLALEPGLWERFTGQGQYKFVIPPLTAKDAVGLIQSRLETARSPNANLPHGLFPFPDKLGQILSPVTISSPRRLIKICFYAISDAKDLSSPFTDEYLRTIERKIYPELEEEA